MEVFHFSVCVNVIIAQCRYTTPLQQNWFLPQQGFFHCTLAVSQFPVPMPICLMCQSISDVPSTLDNMPERVQLSRHSTLPAAGQSFTVSTFKSVSPVSRVTQHLSEVTLSNKQDSEVHNTTRYILYILIT